MKYFIILLSIFLFSVSALSNTTKLLLTTEMNAFGANLEYFNGLRPGELLLNTSLKTSFTYNISTQFSAKAGFYLERVVADKEGVSLARPLFQLTYKKSGFSLFIGDIYTSDRHRLPDAIMYYESQYTVAFEEGIRFVYNYPALYGDIWLNYLALNTKEHLEHLNIGLYIESPKRLLQARGGLLWDHYGGQLFSVEGDYMRDTLNLFSSLTVKKDLASQKVQLGGELGILGSSVTRSRSQEPYQRGYGGYGSIRCMVNRFEFSALYFKGDEFRTSMGNKLYESRDYYFLQVARSHAIAKEVYVDWGVRLEFVDIKPQEFFNDTEYKAWVAIHSGFSKSLFPFKKGIELN